jgi:hypothetical protein
VSNKVSADVSDAAQGLTASSFGACTAACTNQAKTDEADPLGVLAAALLGLSPADRARLATMLLGQQMGQSEGE